MGRAVLYGFGGWECGWECGLEAGEDEHGEGDEHGDEHRYAEGAGGGGDHAHEPGEERCAKAGDGEDETCGAGGGALADEDGEGCGEPWG